MRVKSETIRFWLPVAVLLAFTAYTTRKLVRAHLDPHVDAPNYIIERSLPARRGAIYDCNGRNFPFVKSVPYWEYHLDPVTLDSHVVRPKGEKHPRTRNAIVKTIADALKLEYRTVLKMCNNTKNRYQFLSMSADPDVHDTLANSSFVTGVAIDDRQVRQYLHGNRLSHVIGFANAEGVGSAGLELKYEKTLSGVPGRVRGMKDAHGRELYDKRITSIEPIPGADIFLTVDHNLQYEAEQALAAGVREFGAGTGWCVVLDARTAAVLAMASYPDFSPQVYGRASERAKVNRVTNFTYEPGSVMKVITVAAGIDSGRCTPQTLYSTDRNDMRYYRLPGDGSHRWDPFMSVRDAVVHSSNIVIGKLGVDIGPEVLWRYMRDFGFGEPTGVGLPGEEYGILPNWRKWDKVKWSRAPIGQGVSVTAMQLASAYQAIANAGERLRPYIVDHIVAADGTETYRHRREVVARPIKPATAQKMLNVMQGVATRDGTARRAALRGYSVAGKTGTAQKVENGHYSDSLYRATFCGIVPATAPRFVCLVTLDFEQKTKYHQGGNSAALIFRRTALATLRYLMVEPDRPAELDEAEEDEDEFDRILNERSGRLAASGQ